MAKSPTTTVPTPGAYTLIVNHGQLQVLLAGLESVTGDKLNHVEVSGLDSDVEDCVSSLTEMVAHIVKSRDTNTIHGLCL